MLERCWNPIACASSSSSKLTSIPTIIYCDFCQRNNYRRFRLNLVELPIAISLSTKVIPHVTEAKVETHDETWVLIGGCSRQGFGILGRTILYKLYLRGGGYKECGDDTAQRPDASTPCRQVSPE